MKVLFVSGDSDYAALSFEGDIGVNNDDVKKLKPGESKVFSTDDYHIQVELLEFDSCDPQFIDFVKNRIIDYDTSKHTNFYVVEG